MYCPNCSKELQANANVCPHCRADFTSSSGWRPITKVSASEATLSGTSKIVSAGVLIAALFPVVFLLLVGFSLLIPGCTLGGSGGPAFGCKVLGFSVNWLITLATSAFVFSFVTVPIGLFICFFGSIWSGKSS
jgi:hypothetical protein